MKLTKSILLAVTTFGLVSPSIASAADTRSASSLPQSPSYAAAPQLSRTSAPAQQASEFAPIFFFLFFLAAAAGAYGIYKAVKHDSPSG
ncbi:hypothetical protein [Novosphingobium lentum]|uniref:hypothetical protein n=1 Tax=Novosphingobium lentum TaxID=145287 RepID=UPI00082ECEC9|nr:hypothetical protein [Novosphingobium lentum]